MTTMMKQMVALTRNAHWMPNTFATAYMFFAPPIAAQRRAVNVSIRITSTGAPMAPAIWRTVFVTAEPSLTSSGSRQFSDHVVIGISTNPMPIWRTNCHIDTHQIHEVMEIRLIMMVPNSRVIEPISATGRAPRRSSALPPKNCAMHWPNAPGSITRPLIVAE